MNIFKNIERGVVSAPTNNKKEYRVIDKMSESAASGSYLRKIAETEHAEEVEKVLEQQKADTIKKEKSERVVMKSLQSDKARIKINAINEAAKVGVLKDILFEVFYNSLVLDEEFLAQQESSLRYIIDKYVDDNGGFSLIENAVKVSDSILLKKMKNLCESTARCICDRKMKDAKSIDDPSELTFDVTDDEKEKLNYGKSNLDIDRISELVKNKVLTVIQDEKHRQESETERMNEIEDEVKASIDEATSEAIDIAFDKIVLSKPTVESGTLFNALLRSTYREFLLENVAISSTDQSNIEKVHDKSATYDVNTKEDDVIADDVDNEDDEVETSEINPDLLYENSSSIDMDIILTESIAKYTLMEMLYTLKLENYTYENMAKLTERLLNPVVESAKKTKQDNSFIEIRSEFFKSFNNILNLNKIDKSKKDITSLKTKCEDSKQNLTYFDSCVKTAIKEVNTAKEKNPKLAKQYDEILDWLKGLNK